MRNLALPVWCYSPHYFRKRRCRMNRCRLADDGVIAQFAAVQGKSVPCRTTHASTHPDFDNRSWCPGSPVTIPRKSVQFQLAIGSLQLNSDLAVASDP